MFGFGSKSPPPVPDPTYSAELDSGPNEFQPMSSPGISDDAELQRHLMREQQRAQFQEQISKFNDICWETCIDKPSSRLDSRTEACLVNCVNRFIDVNLLLAQRFAQMLQQSGGF